MTRYEQIPAAIALFRPKTIIETGTWKGINAVRMLNVAASYHECPEYTGFDLFEEATDETDKEEFNVKKHPTLEGARAKIERKCAFDKEVTLVKGNTRDTLKEQSADFAFIDGGHSIETIRHDYEMLKGCGVILLDDYYLPDHDGKCPDITKMGCNRLVSEIEDRSVTVLPSRDWLGKKGGVVHLVLVV